MQDIISRLTVAPQRFEHLAGAGATFARNGEGCFTIEMSAQGQLCAQAEQLVRDTLSADFADGGEKTARIVLELSENLPDIPNAEQGYRLSVRDDTVILTGFGQQGLLYGAVTLCQLIKGHSGLPAFEITDWPDIEKRGHFIESRFGTDLMELDDWQKVIDDMVLILRDRHTKRLKAGTCSVTSGLVFMEALTYLERVADHCSSIGVMMIARDNDEILGNHHKYLQEVHSGSDAGYRAECQRRREQYLAPLDNFQ